MASALFVGCLIQFIVVVQMANPRWRHSLLMGKAALIAVVLITPMTVVAWYLVASIGKREVWNQNQHDSASRSLRAAFWYALALSVVWSFLTSISAVFFSMQAFGFR